MITQRVRFSLALFFAVVFFMGTSHAVFAISTSPPLVEAPTVLKGVTQKAKVNIGRIPSEIGDINIAVTATGEAASYLVFEPSWVLPAGINNKDYIFSIDGNSAQVGSYKAFLTFSKVASPESAAALEGSTAMSVIAGVGVTVEFTVTGDQVVGYTLGDITVPSIESDKHPFAAFSFSNTGNVDWKPDGANITITNQEDETLKVTSALSGDAFTMTPPGESSRQMIEIPELLLEGSYVLSADILFGGAVVGTMKSQPFPVVSPGTLLQSGKVITATTPKTTVSVNEIIPITITFVNDGQVPIRGVASAEISRDGVYYDLLVGDEQQIVNGQTVDFPLSTHFSEPGSYTIKTFVKFANRKSNSVNIDITTGSGSVAVSALNDYRALAIFSGLILCAAGAFVLYKKHKRNNPVVQSIPQPIPSVAPAPPVPQSESAPLVQSRNTVAQKKENPPSSPRRW